MTPLPSQTLQTQRQVQDLLELLPHLNLLGEFLEPQNPSQVARRLGLPANRVHYHVKRFVRQGFLQAVTTKGRSTSYQATALEFRAPEQLVSLFSVRQMVQTTLDGFSRHVISQFEQSSLRFDPTEDDESSLIVSLTKGVSSSSQSEPKRRWDIPQLNGRVLRLSSTGYQKLMQQLQDLLAETEQDPEAASFSFVVIGTPGHAFINNA